MYFHAAQQSGALPTELAGRRFEAVGTFAFAI